jgi:hypothetical protein
VLTGPRQAPEQVAEESQIPLPPLSHDVPGLPKGALNAFQADNRLVESPEDLTDKTTAQTSSYTHRGLDEQASSIRPGVLTPDTLPCRVLKTMDGPEGRHGKMRERFSERL